MLEKRHKVLAASYLVLIKDGKILMLRRFNTGYKDGNYSLPAGCVNKGETFTQCVIREAMEETGILMDHKAVKVAHVMHRYDESLLENETVDVFFTTDKWDGEATNKEPEKCDDLSWFDLESLPENALPHVKLALENIKNKVIYSEIGW
ncbi:MAG: NUDIX domain-containing protein [Candidatus Staskawiczbacteria bacterium]|jgi:ADP-ribose pyrophosphatase YjhB (NUDIX family)